LQGDESKLQRWFQLLQHVDLLLVTQETSVAMDFDFPGNITEQAISFVRGAPPTLRSRTAPDLFR
jgi:hypothetical protein